MIHAINRPLSEYRNMGIPLAMYFNDEEYTNLFALTSPKMFWMESGTKAYDHDYEILIRDENLEKTLDKKVGPFTVRQLLHKFNPVGVYNAFSRNPADTNKLPVLQGYKANKRELGDFLSIVLMRATVWAQHYNQAVASVDAVFKLVPITLPEEAIKLTKAFQGVVYEQLSV